MRIKTRGSRVPTKSTTQIKVQEPKQKIIKIKFKKNATMHAKQGCKIMPQLAFISARCYCSIFLHISGPDNFYLGSLVRHLYGDKN